MILNRNHSLDHQVQKTVSRFYYWEIIFPVQRKNHPSGNTRVRNQMIL